MNRKRRLLLLVLVLVLTLGGATYLISAGTQRLDFGGFYGRSPDDSVTELRAGRTHELRFPFRANGTFTFYTSIRNPGRWPVKVTEVSLTGWSGGPDFSTQNLSYGYQDQTGPANAYLPAHARPWQPVTVEPDAVLTLFVTVTMPDVEMAEGSTISWETVGVRYSVLGLPHEQRVPLGFFLSVGG